MWLIVQHLALIKHVQACAQFEIDNKMFINLPKNTKKAVLFLRDECPVVPFIRALLIAIGLGLSSPDGWYTPSR